MLNKLVYSIGYDGYSSHEFIITLKKLNVTILVDIRSELDKGATLSFE